MADKSATRFPQFDPRITTHHGDTHYDDGRVSGTVDEFVTDDGRRGLSIFEWSSQFPSQGHTIEALSWLKARYDIIAAHGIGEFDEDDVPDISINYWEAVYAKGLVDVLILDDGNEWTPPSLLPHP